MTFKKLVAMALAYVMVLALGASALTLDVAESATEAVAEEAVLATEADTWDGTVDKSWYNDTDTEFTITTAEQLAGFGVLVDGGNTFDGKTIKLGADLDLKVVGTDGELVSFNPIGYGYNVVFKGTFDGQGHTISNLYQNGWALGYNYSTEGGGLFASAVDATFKNLTIDNAEIVMECIDMGILVGYSYGTATYTDITISNSTIANYNRYTGGVVGEVNGSHTFVNVDVIDTTVASLWGSFDTSLGGIIGGKWGDATVVLKNCDVACVIDAFNDVTSAYEWYAYRRAGMLIGNAETDNGANGATAPYLTAENCTVTYGDWANYTYCKFSAMYYPWVRVQAGLRTDAYSNPRYGHPTDANGNTVVDDNHAHNAGEAHLEMLVFNQLYGGGQGVYGEDEHEGVTINVSPEAKIGDDLYASLEEALAAVENNETVTLLADVELDRAISFTKDIAFTIDGAGHKISPAANSTEANSAFNFGQGNDSTIATRKYDIKNVVFDGWTTDHVLRLQGTDSDVSGCTFVNCNQPDGAGLITLTFCDADIINCTFKDNTCVKVIDVNSNSHEGSAADNVFTIDGCTFENNTCSSVGVIYYHRGESFTLTDNEFVSNNVNIPLNGATVYCGYKENVTITGNLFSDNVIDSASNDSRVSPTIFVGNTSVITNNAFVNNTGKRNGVLSDDIAQVVVSTYYNDIDISGNYWGNSTPVAGKDYNRIHKDNGYDLVLDDYYASYDDTTGTLDNLTDTVAKVDDQFFATLTDAFATVDDGETIELLPVEISEGTVKLPASLKNVKLVGVENAVIKDTVIMAHDGNAISYEGITVENVVFDNSYFSITGWRANGVVLKNFTFKNNTFKNIDNTSNTAAVHFNLAEHEAMSGFVFENNTIENVLGGSKSGVYAQVTGDVTIKNNLIKNVAFRPFVIQVTTDDGVADNVTVTENTFRGSAAGRLQLLGNNKAGTDTVSIKTTENAILDTTDVQAICYWNFNDEATTADFSKNYYGVIDPTEDFNKFYYNKSASSYEDIINMGILPYYTDATFDANGKYTELTNLTEGLSKNITVAFDEVLPAVEGEKTYNINLVSNDEAIINRLNSGDLTFKLNVTEPGKVAYEILDIVDDNITVAMVNNDANRYEFHFDTKTNVENDTAKSITIAKVKFTGYGDFTFVVDSDKKTNTVHTTTTADNIVDTYLPAGITESDGTAPEGTLDLGTGVKTQIKVPTRDLVINVAFPNAVEKKAAAYQAMKVTVSGGDLAEAVVVDLGAENVETAITSEFEKNDAKYTVEVADGYKVTFANVLTVNTTYNITVEGAGYRTSRYTVTMTDVKTLNFWNNVKDNAVEVEDGKSASATSKNFLAGDIVGDNQINIYDLSAVVSYFATNTSADYAKYTKYDLDRNGVIDSKDVAYVLVSWGE